MTVKNRITRYRSIAVIASALVFNLVTSLLVWHPDGVIFNESPMTLSECICDIIGAVVFFSGILMMLYDANEDSKKKMEEAFKNGADELRKVGVEFEVKYE